MEKDTSKQKTSKKDVAETQNQEGESAELTERQTEEETNIPQGKPRGIHQAMIAVGKRIRAVSKDRKNREQGFAYRSIDDVYNMLQPAMADAGLYCLLERVENRAETSFQTKAGGRAKSVTLDAFYRLTAEDGTSITGGPIPSEAFDTGDKATGKALAYAHKIFLLQTFCFPTEDMQRDPDSDKIEMGAENGRQNGQSTESDKQKTAEEKAAEEARLKGICKDVAEKMNAAKDPEKVHEIMDQAKKDLPPSLHPWIAKRGCQAATGVLIQAYDNAKNQGQLDEAERIHSTNRVELDEPSTKAVETARTDAVGRIDDIPF